MSWLSASEPLRLLLELLIKSTAVLSAALLAAALLRKRSAALRHFVLTLFLAGLLVLPALTPARFGWETGLLPSPHADSARSTGPGDGREPGTTAGETGTGPHRGGRSAVEAAGPSETGLRDGSARDGLLPLAGSSEGGPASGVPFPRASTRAARRVLAVVFSAIWAAGLALFLLRLATGLHGAYRLTREGEAVHDPAWRVLLERFLVLLGLRRSVNLKSHDNIVVPLTWGFIRPVILIPGDYRKWTEGQKSSALLHELSHIKRADFLVMMLVRLSLAVFWWNPLAWVAFGMLKKEQEKACDELVLRTGLKPSTYAANLLLFRDAAGLRWDPSAALLGMFGRSSLNERLAAILKQKLILKEVGMKTKIMLGVVAVLAVAVIGIARPEAAAAATSNASTLTGPAALGLVEDIVPAEAPAQIGGPAEAEAPAVDVAPAQEKEKQEKEKQEKEKVKKEKELSIVLSTKDGKKVPIEITVLGVDGAKTLKLEKDIILKKGEAGELLLLDSEGKEIEVLKGDPIHIQVVEGDVELHEGGKALKVVESGDLKLVMEKDKGQIAWTVKEGDVKEGISYHIVPKSGEAGGVAYFIGEDADKKVHITVQTGKDGKEIAWVSKADIEPHIVVEGLDVKPHVVFVGKGEARPHIAVNTVTDLKPRIAWTMRADEQELREKLEELRATLEKVKAKELDLSALEKALDEMEAGLKEKEALLKTIDLHFSEKPVNYSIVRKGDEKGDVVVWVGEGEAPHPVTITTGTKGDFSMAIAFGAQEMSRETYERVVESVKKELPEGYEIESDFESGANKKSGVITLKIKGPDDKKGVSAELAKKLAEALKKAIKK